MFETQSRPLVHRRLIFVCNQLPLRVKGQGKGAWSFEWDEDALIAQAREGLPEDMEAVYVGCLPMEVDGADQDVSAVALGDGAGGRTRVEEVPT